MGQGCMPAQQERLHGFHHCLLHATVCKASVLVNPWVGGHGNQIKFPFSDVLIPRRALTYNKL